MIHTIRNARIVTANDEFLGQMSYEDGYIHDVASDHQGLTGTDWGGDYLLPGLVEIHTDNLEKHLMPRPKVSWPILPAIAAHDAQIAASGITTVLDAIAVGDIDTDSMRMKTLHASIAGLRTAADAGMLRADHFLHLRLELAEPDLISLFSPFLKDDRLKLVSLMDHTPGQRQWTDMHHYRVYVTGKRGWSNEKVDGMLDHLLERQQTNAATNRREVVRLCRESTHPIPLATHDDTTIEHVTEGVEEGVTMSEFPTTIDAARAAHQYKLKIIMGAPNVVRGGSHSGNVSALELAKHGLLDVLSSDYVPASLLHAAFLLQSQGFSLSRAIATVASNPATLLGLHDRGDIANGLRADFIRVRLIENFPVILGVWKAGRQIA